MPDSRAIVAKSLEVGVAIPAFNVPYLPMIKPVIQAVIDQNCFAMIETARLEWFKFEAGSPEAVAEEFFRWQNPDFVNLHLDHIPVIDEDGQEVDYISDIRKAIKLGYHSVMVDGSRLPLEANIKATRQVSELAHKAGIPCEAELGAILGHEAGPMPPYQEFFASGKGFTKVDEARQFVTETGCDWLSVAIGNVHGAISAGYKDKKKIAARLDIDHLKKLSDAVSIPLVLHGGSGIPRDFILASLQNGIAKINIATEIRQAYENALQDDGSVPAAQQAVYDRTSWLIGDYLGLSDTQPLVAQDLS
jgi:ketose-bisphosphate aldolase